MSKVDQIRSLREAQFSKPSLANPRAETAKTTESVVNETRDTTKSVVKDNDGNISTTKSVGNVLMPMPEATKSVVSLPDDFKALMELADLTQKQFAELTGTPLRTIEDWSRGASPAPPIAKAWLRLYIETG